MTEPTDTHAPIDETPWAELRERFRKSWSYKGGYMAAGVYRLYDSCGHLLYVGLGSTPYNRWKDHARKKPWWVEVDHARTTVEWFRKYKDAMDAETAAIRTEDPLHNAKDSKRRLHWTQQRWHADAVEIADGSEVPIDDLWRRLSDVLIAVRTLRRVVFVAKLDRRLASIVPAEIGDLVQRVGADHAAAILRKHLTEPADDD